MADMPHAWLTRDCLSKGGIRRIRIEYRPGSSVLVRNADSRSGQWYILGIEVFADFKAALANARQQRDRRIKYLEGQIMRLHRLEFKE